MGILFELLLLDPSSQPNSSDISKSWTQPDLTQLNPTRPMDGWMDISGLGGAS